MYNAQIIKERIKEQQKVKGVKNSDNMMNELGLGINIIRQMSDKKGVGCFAIAKIADYLDCSVDYLLGRNDNPSVTNSISNSHTTVNGTQANIINNSEPLDEMTTELLKAFKKLTFKDKLEIINAVLEKNKTHYESGKKVK